MVVGAFPGSIITAEELFPFRTTRGNWIACYGDLLHSRSGGRSMLRWKHGWESSSDVLSVMLLRLISETVGTYRMSFVVSFLIGSNAPPQSRQAWVVEDDEDSRKLLNEGLCERRIRPSALGAMAGAAWPPTPGQAVSRSSADCCRRLLV